jgi:hypothetical protein
MLDLLVALVLPLLLAAYLRWLAHRWMPWAMRPAERLVSGIWRTIWDLVWRKPAAAWGALNTLWIWLTTLAVVLTVYVFRQGVQEPWGVIGVWAIVVGVWWGLRAWNLWRFRPHRLPRRRRRD